MNKSQVAGVLLLLAVATGECLLVFRAPMKMILEIHEDDFLFQTIIMLSGLCEICVFVLSVSCRHLDRVNQKQVEKEITKNS